MADKLFRLSNPVHFLALGFGSGLLPIAPGTWGTLITIPIYWVLMSLEVSLPVYLGVCGFMFLVGIGLCSRTTADAGVHDPRAIVWDEMVGYLVTMILLPFEWGWIIAGFFVFRIFDVIKPWPIGWVDKNVHGGFGIMVDDVLAGLASCAVLHLAVWVLAVL
jgi:phosphatidylglycerophosphatase A